MQPEVTRSYEEIEKLSAQVQVLCNKFKIKLNPSSDLFQMMRLCEAATQIKNKNLEDLVNLLYAQDALLAILACEDDAALDTPLRRIAKKSLNWRSTKHSEGKDALFELRFLRYVKHRGIYACIGEPDVHTKIANHDYFVACKSINSLNNVEGQVRIGKDQVTERGYGCVALNFSAHILGEQPFVARHALEVFTALHSQLSQLYSERRHMFNRKLTEGGFDGIVLQVTCSASIAESANRLDLVTHSVYYSRSNLQSRDAGARFNVFRSLMNGKKGA